MNVYLAGAQNIIANMQDSTDAIRKAFVNANSCVPPKPYPLPDGAHDAGSMDAPWRGSGGIQLG